MSLIDLKQKLTMGSGGGIGAYGSTDPFLFWKYFTLINIKYQ